MGFKLIHLTDLHLVAPGRRLCALDPETRLRTAVEQINRQHLDAAFVLITGDLSYHGGVPAYRLLREIRAELTLYYPDNTTETVATTEMVSGPSDPNEWEQSFNWVVDAPRVQPGTQYSVALYEVDTSMADTPEPSPIPRLPLTGQGWVGAESYEMEMKGTVLPAAGRTRLLLVFKHLTRATAKLYRHPHFFCTST